MLALLLSINLVNLIEFTCLLFRCIEEVEVPQAHRITCMLMNHCRTYGDGYLRLSRAVPKTFLFQFVVFGGKLVDRASFIIYTMS